MITKTMSLLTVLFMGCAPCMSNNNDDLEVRKCLISYSKYANEQNADAMNNILHPSFRSVANQLFGNEDISITDKASYLQLLRSKKLGGGNRTMTIKSVDVSGKTACAKIEMKGESLSFSMYVFLAQSANGDWKIISDLPHILP